MKSLRNVSLFSEKILDWNGILIVLRPRTAVHFTVMDFLNLKKDYFAFFRGSCVVVKESVGVADFGRHRTRDALVQCPGCGATLATIEFAGRRRYPRHAGWPLARIDMA